MKKKLLSIILSMVTLLSATFAVQAENDYIPLRRTFEEKGFTVIWTDESPDDILVKIGDYDVKFRSGTNTVDVDEGTFHTEQITYIEDGTTYISKEAASLCENLYLYHNAVEDAIQADEDEILPLHPIDKSAGRVLVCTWHKYPDSYPTGEEIEIKYGDVWVFTADEISQFGSKNGYSDDMVLRMEQLIGIPPQAGKTHFTTMWADPDDLYRPSADRQIDTASASLDFPAETDAEYIEWFNSNMNASYYPHRYPWTRLGYTYDWADNGTEYGLSEYVLKNGSTVTVEKTYTNEEFFEYITSIDYSDEDSWAFWNKGEDKEADLFIVCPTVDMGKNGNLNADINDENYRSSFIGALNMELGIYSDSAAVYAPFYRQAAFPVYNMTEAERESYLGIAYEDVRDAFLYYAEHTNSDRPLILAGFSQGSDMVIRLMKDLFDKEEYSGRLAAAYCIGWKLTEADIKEYPQLKPAQGEDDIGVIITFNSEAESVTSSLLVGENEKTYAINPLNWKIDGTKADKSLNSGACFTDYSGEINREIPNLTGAYIDESRGTLKLPDIKPSDYSNSLFEDGIYHLYDYQFFYRNLQENVKIRLDGYNKQKAA
ncbi:MAG: DUF3089 domain-containing protein [Monoglobaceae bacterium]